MKYVPTLFVLAVLFIPFSFLQAQTPCGNIIGPENPFEVDSPLEIIPITNCENPFNETLDVVSPYTLFIDDILVADEGTIEVPEGGTRNFRIEGEPGASDVLFIHDGDDYRYVNTQDVEPTESDYRRLAVEFLGPGVDIEPYMQASEGNPADYFETEEEMEVYYDYVDYCIENFVYAPPPLREGTYTLVLSESSGMLNQRNLFQRFFSLIIPTANAQSYPDHEYYIFTITFTLVEASQVEDCCSSVVFLPGIKGSILKKDRFLGTEDTLWPATMYSDDVAQLALNEDGVSISDVFVDGIVNTYLGEPVYEPFSLFMDDLVASETIVAWKPIPYDWRLLPGTILEDGVKTRDGVVDIIEQIEALAGTSNTGQVTIVAHSMGGLMGKAIIKKLEEEGKDDLIDAFIMVGSPQLGTPQAIGSLLHGNDESIPGNLEGLASILNNSSVETSAARQMAQNMPSAYNLLPSPAYFGEVSDPVLKFDETSSFTDSWRAFWGTTINTYTKFAEFITGQGVTRVNPGTNELNIPEILNEDIVDSVKDFHQEYDSYEFPDNIRVVEIAGWGRPTVKGILYTTEHDKQSYVPLFTVEGDKTVTYPSAISSEPEEEYFLHLFDYNDTFGTQADHKDLLSVEPVQKLVSTLIKKEAFDNDIDFITTMKPSTSDVSQQLLVSSHSPVILGVTDSEGNFTGVDVDEEKISEEIPGSSLRIFGQSQYIFLPKTGTYNFMYEGTGSGSTTITIETFSNDVTTPVASYTDMPTILGTVATFGVNSSAPADTQIKLDKDGDGVVDTTVKADTYEPTLSELVALLKTTVNGLNLKKQLKKNLLTKVSLLKKVITIKNKKLLKLGVNLNVGFIKFEVEILKKSKKISKQDATTILNLLNEIKGKI
jgi:pimeloyl-ACP methyl ester carboxylesterase